MPPVPHTATSNLWPRPGPVKLSSPRGVKSPRDCVILSGVRWIRHATFGVVGPAVLVLGVGAIGAQPVDPDQAPLPPPGFLKGCLALIEQKRYEQARQLLVPVVADHPGWARAHFYLALTYHKENRYERARELFRRALQLDPEEQSVRMFYGW